MTEFIRTKGSTSQNKMNDVIITADTGEKGEPEINLTGMVVENPVVSCRIEGEDGAILFNPDTDDTLLINSTGFSIWTFLDQPRTIDDIVLYFSATFSNCPDHFTMRQEIEAFIRELVPKFVLEADVDTTESNSS